MIDALPRLIDHYGKLIGKQADRTQEDEIANVFFQILLLMPLYQIVKTHRLVRHAQAPCPCRFPFMQTVTADSRIDGSPIDTDSGIGNFPSCTGATVHKAFPFQFIKNGTIGVDPVCLTDNRAIPFKTESFKGFQDRGFIFRMAAGFIDVFDTDDPLASIGFRIEITADRGNQ